MMVLHHVTLSHAVCVLYPTLAGQIYTYSMQLKILSVDTLIELVDKSSRKENNHSFTAQG
jgi:hypothetical protein